MSDEIGDSRHEPAGRRVNRFLGWARDRSDRPAGRLALQWFHSYFDASRNSGCAIAIYSSLSVLPATLVFVAALYAPGGDANVFAQRLVDHLNLTGDTAKLVEGTFGSASSNALAATLTTIVTFLLWGIGIGQLYQDFCARAWGISVGSAADQALYAIFFFIFAGAFTLVLAGQAELTETGGRAVLIPAWLGGSLVFWILVPYVLLHRKIALRRLLPGALLAAVVLGGTPATAPLFLSATLTANGKAFGSFGIALTLVGYLFILVTLSLVCAVFSPVWFAWRGVERRPREGQEPPPAGEPLD